MVGCVYSGRWRVQGSIREVGQSCCRILKLSGNTRSGRVGETCHGLTGGCRPSAGPKSGRTRGGFGRIARTCSMLDSPRGGGLCSRFNRTTFSRDNTTNSKCKGTNANNFKKFNKGNKFGNNACHDCNKPKDKCRRCRFRNNSVSSVFNSVFKGVFRKKDTSNHDEEASKFAKKFKNRDFGSGNSSVGTNVAMKFSRTTFNKSGIVALDGPRGPKRPKRSLGIRVPTNVSDKGSVHLEKGKVPKANNNRTKSLLLGMAITPGPKCRQGNVSMCAAMSIPCAATIFKNRTLIRALCKSIVYGVGRKARSNSGVHLENGKVISVGSSSIRKSRCMAVRVRIPEGLDPRTERGLGRFRRVYRKDSEATWVGRGAENLFCGLGRRSLIFSTI